MKTKQDIINFLESQVGTKVKCKGGPSLDGQCVTLIKALMEFIGAPDPYKPRGHAKDCITSYLNEGIANEGIGFLSVFSNKNMGGGYGHVWCNAGEGNGTYYESNGVKPLLCTKGKTYSYDKVCNFDKWIKEEKEEKENNMNELLQYLDVKSLDEAKGKLKEHLGEKDGKCGWGSNKDMGYLGSERDKNHNLYLDFQAEKQKVEKLELDLKVCKSEKEFITKDYQEMFSQNENHASLYHQELNNNLKLTEKILNLEKELDQIKSERDKSLTDKDKQIKALEGKVLDLEKIIKEQGDVKDRAKLQLNGLKTALYEFIAEIYESIKKGGK